MTFHRGTAEQHGVNNTSVYNTMRLCITKKKKTENKT